MKELLMMSICNPAFWALVAFAQLASAQTVDQLIPHNVKLESVDYRGKRAVKITEDGQVANGEAYAIVKGTLFHNGAIEVELAGRSFVNLLSRLDLETGEITFFLDIPFYRTH